MSHKTNKQTDCPVSQFTNSDLCLIYESSFKFCRAFYAILVLIAFLLRNQWVLLAAIVLMYLRIFSIKLDFPYQFHALFIRKWLNDKSEPVLKEKSELNFVFGMMATMLLIAFLLIYFNKFVTFAWIFVLIVDFLMFLAALVNFCLATLIYILFKNIFKIKKKKILTNENKKN